MQNQGTSEDTTEQCIDTDAQIESADSIEIPEILDDVPKIDDPTARELATARRLYGVEHVPAGGPIPDPWAYYEIPVDIEIPEWLVSVTVSRLDILDNPNREDARDLLFDHVTASEQFRTPDGRDVITMVLNNHDRR